MNRFSILMLFVLANSKLFSQELPTGLEYPNTSVYKSMLFPALPNVSFGIGDNEDHILEGLPPVSTQATIGSCVSWATTYYLYSYLNKRENNFKDYYSGGTLDETKLFSPLYTHNNIKLCSSDCRKCGSANYTALNFLQKTGAVPLSLFPETGFNNPVACQISPDPKLKSAAFLHKISNYTCLINPVFKYEPGEKYRKIKNALLSNYPVVIGMPVDESFKRAEGIKNYTWKTFTGNVNRAENHSMLCIGFSDKRDAIYVINSWSTKWGDQGFGWISTKVLEKYLVEAYLVNVPSDLLVKTSDIIDYNSKLQATTKSTSEGQVYLGNKKKLELNKPKKSFFAKNRYQEFDNLRIIPIKIDRNSAVIKFYRKEGSSTFSIIDISTIKINEKHLLNIDDHTYLFQIFKMAPWRFWGKGSVEFTMTLVK